MNPRDAHPLDFFNEWFAEPITVADNSVAGVIEALNRHPMADDQTAQDYVMPLHRCREHDGRYRIYGENQDVYYCFVYSGDESQSNPPVYFESCLDLRGDYGIDDSEIIQNDHFLLAANFTDFLWHILGHHICVRLESGGQFVSGVTGLVFADTIELDSSFHNPVGREFPAGYTCFVNEEVIYVRHWGAAFLSRRSRDAFVTRFSPNVWREWA